MSYNAAGRAELIDALISQLVAALAALPARADMYGYISALEAMTLDAIPPRLVIFDADGTVIPGWKERGQGEIVLLPNVAEKLAEIRKRGGKIAIATNQGGPALRDYLGRSDARPSFMEVAHVYFHQLGRLIPDAKIFMALGYEFDGRWLAPVGISSQREFIHYSPTAFYSAHQRWRKPQPGMLLDAMRMYKVSAESTLFVGDSETDRLAAEAAGVRFAWAKDFFGWEL